jgi:hypothetical protein
MDSEGHGVSIYSGGWGAGTTQSQTDLPARDLYPTFHVTGCCIDAAKEER